MRTPWFTSSAVSAAPAAVGSDPGFAGVRHAYVRGERASPTFLTADGEEVGFSADGWQPRRVPVRDARARDELDTSALHAGD